LITVLNIGVSGNNNVFLFMADSYGFAGRTSVSNCEVFHFSFTLTRFSWPMIILLIVFALLIVFIFLVFFAILVVFCPLPKVEPLDPILKYVYKKLNV
jgi:hypothetical protein